MIVAIETRRLIIFIPVRGKSSTAQILSSVQPKLKPKMSPVATCPEIQRRAENPIFMFFVSSDQSPSRRTDHVNCRRSHRSARAPPNPPEILRHNFVHIGHKFRPVDDST
jgi:hypothetical protein